MMSTTSPPAARYRSTAAYLTRQRLGLTQAELAELVGVHPRTVLRWEETGASPPSGPAGKLMAALAAMTEDGENELHIGGRWLAPRRWMRRDMFEVWALVMHAAWVQRRP